MVGWNTSCPISGAGEFSVTGPTNLGTRTIPMSATYTNGLLTNLTITGAVLGNGIKLDVTTNGLATPGDSNFIQGSFYGANEGPNGSPIATYAVDAFGDGTLTLNYGSGNTYGIADWHVVRAPGGGGLGAPSN